MTYHDANLTSQIHDAMLRRKSIFLSKPDWYTIPWQHIPKDATDLLFDITAQLPSLFERALRLRFLPPSPATNGEILPLLQSLLVIDRLYHNRLTDLHARGRGPLFWTSENEAGSEGKVPLPSGFGTEIRFKGISVALLHLNQWAAMVLLHLTVAELRAMLWEETDREDLWTVPAVLAPLLELGDGARMEQAQARLEYSQPESSTAAHLTTHATSAKTLSSPLTPISSYSPSPPFQALSFPSQQATSTVASSLPTPTPSLYASLILRSLPYARAQTAGQPLGTELMALPLWCAFQHYRTACAADHPPRGWGQQKLWSEQKRWCEVFVEQMAACGLKFAGEVLGVGWDEYAGLVPED